MADIGKDLRDYLSRNEKHSNNPALLGQNNISTYIPNVSNWFTSKQNPTDSDSGDGWFANAQKDPLLPSLVPSKTQRIIGFVGFLVMGCFCFTLATFYIPVLILKARKFALLYTLGSLFVVSSFAVLWGPIQHIKHLFSSSRLPFTTMYFGSMFATLYFALEVRSTPLTVIFAVLQVFALLWYVFSYIPGGQSGLKFFTRIFSFSVNKSVQNTLPV